MASKYSQQADTTIRRYERELNSLFGHDVKERARTCDLASKHIDEPTLERLQSAVDRLIQAEEYPQTQRKILAGMCETDKTVLYLWLTDFNVFALHNECY
jgi:hypothetical protein